MKRTQKGITLIALIITIIVMLILVAVTINVALNGGIFDKAKQAKEDTQVEVDKEKLLSAAMACVGEDGKIAFTGSNGLDANLPTGFSGTNGTYTKDGNTYTVDPETGKITSSEPTTGGGAVTSQEKIYVYNPEGSYAYNEAIISVNENNKRAKLYFDILGEEQSQKIMSSFNIENDMEEVTVEDFDYEDIRSLVEDLIESLDNDNADLNHIVFGSGMHIFEVDGDWYIFDMQESGKLLAKLIYQENYDLSEYDDAQIVPMSGLDAGDDERTLNYGIYLNAKKFKSGIKSN